MTARGKMLSYHHSILTYAAITAQMKTAGIMQLRPLWMHDAQQMGTTTSSAKASSISSAVTFASEPFYTQANAAQIACFTMG